MENMFRYRCQRGGGQRAPLGSLRLALFSAPALLEEVFEFRVRGAGSVSPCLKASCSTCKLSPPKHVTYNNAFATFFGKIKGMLQLFFEDLASAATRRR